MKKSKGILSNVESDIVFNIDRYELKFVIPLDMVDFISDFASIYCSLDRYSEMSDDGFYRVNNLYFDTPNYLFLKKRVEGSENRFNMRIRSYNDQGDMPIFFEIKQKNVNIVKKTRAIVINENWRNLFNIPLSNHIHDINRVSASNEELFLNTAFSYNAKPKVLTQYKRKAYVSDIDSYARITFDMNLRYQPVTGYQMKPDEDQMVPLDNSTLFDPECSVVLELKCHTTQVPLWMIDLIRYFNLNRRSFSKYVTGISEVLNLYNYDLSRRWTSLEDFK